MRYTRIVMSLCVAVLWPSLMWSPGTGLGKQEDEGTGTSSELRDQVRPPLTQISLRQPFRPKAIVALIRNGFPDPQGLVNMYNEHTITDGPDNDAGDIGVSFSGRSMLDWVNQLQGIEDATGQATMTVYFSIADIQNNIAVDKSQGVDWIFYDLEGGLSPPSEVNDPINSINTAASIVHGQGLKFGFTVVNVGQHPRNIIPSVAQNAEGYDPQGQNFILQGCSVYAQEVGDMIILAKQTNPNILTWSQVSLLKGTVAKNQQCFRQLDNYLVQRGYDVEGVTVFYNNLTSEVRKLDQFYDWFTANYR